MPDRWEFKSRTYDNCNCAVNCGCQFHLPSTHGFCQSAYVGTVVEGHFNDAPLTGLRWAALYRWPGEVAEGNGRRQIIVDERADEAQRVALETIVSGGACAPLSNVFAVYASVCTEFCPTLFLPIHLDADFEDRRAEVRIPGILTSRARSIVNEFTGEPFHIGLARSSGGFEFTHAELALGTTTASGEMEMAFEDSYAMFCVHHFDQDGLIQEKLRMTRASETTGRWTGPAPTSRRATEYVWRGPRVSRRSRMRGAQPRGDEGDVVVGLLRANHEGAGRPHRDGDRGAGSGSSGRALPPTTPRRPGGTAGTTTPRPKPGRVSGSDAHAPGTGSHGRAD